MNAVEKSPGQIACEAFVRALAEERGPNDPAGPRFPAWEELTPSVRNAWERAAAVGRAQESAS